MIKTVKLPKLFVAAAALAFIAGAFALDGNRSTYATFFGALCVSMVTMAAAVGVDWPYLADVRQVVFMGLGIVGGYVLFRGGRAGTQLSERYDDDWYERYADDIGYSLVWLFVGFVLVLAMDLGLPAWGVVLMSAASLAGGFEMFRSWRRRPHVPAH